MQVTDDLTTLEIAYMRARWGERRSAVRWRLYWILLRMRDAL